MPTPFESFVNAELPKRIATNSDPLIVPAGMVPVTTGVGLLTEFKPYLENGQIDQAAIFSLISSLIICNEIPISLNNSSFSTLYPFSTGSLMVYLNGIRLLPGTNNDFYELDQNTFTIVDYLPTDIVLIDYKRAL